jgi:hypothetical protein
MESQAYRLMIVLVEYAQTSLDMEKAAQFYRELIGSPLSQTEIEIQLASAIVDGLRHGNWPWTNYAAATKE